MATAPAPPLKDQSKDQSVGNLLMEASREASLYFENKFDRSLLHHASTQVNIDWLLSEVKHPAEHPGVLFSNLSPPGKEGKYTFLVPKDPMGEGAGSKGVAYHLTMQEMHQVTRELMDGIYVFNQLPQLELEPNYDCSSTSSIPSAYHDTLIGASMFQVDYFVKSLVHGSTVAQKDKRMRLLDEWKKFPSSNLRKEFVANGMTSFEDDKEFGKEVYTKTKVPFKRYPPKCVHDHIAIAQLTPKLTTGEHYEQKDSHISRDLFIKYLDHVSIGIEFGQREIWQQGEFFVINPCFKVTTGLVAMSGLTDPSLYSHLHSYLQKQRTFVSENLFKKADIAHSINLLSFVSFMIYFLITLKKNNRIIDVTSLLPSKARDATRTDREVPPILPMPFSHWSLYVSDNSCTALQGKISFSKMFLSSQQANLTRQNVADIKRILTPPELTSTSRISKSSLLSVSSALLRTTVDGENLPQCTIGEHTYSIVEFTTEPYYPKTPKLPRWVHAMTAELKAQCMRLPPIGDGRIQDMLRKPFGPRKATLMKTVNVSLQASIEKGLLPAVGALLKRCTQTRLGKADDSGMTMLHYAAAHGRSHVLSALILAGSTLNQPIAVPSKVAPQTCAVHLVAMSGSLDALCCLDRYGADLWVKDSNGWMPLHHAAFNNHQLLVKYLLYSDLSKINEKTTEKLEATPLLLAAQNGCLDTFEYLVELDSCIDVSTKNGCTVVHLAAFGYHIDILKYLINLGSNALNVWEVLSNMLKAPETTYAEAAARCFDLLTQWKPAGHTELLKHGAIESLVLLLQKDYTLKLLVVQVLANLSNLEGVKATLIESNAIPQLIRLLSSECSKIQACVCIVLCDLAMNPDPQMTIVDGGAIPLLTKLLDSKEDNVQLFSCACLGILAYENVKGQNLISKAKALPTLVSMLNSSLSCIKASATDALQRIVERNRSNQLAVLDEKVVPPLLLMLRSIEVAVQKSAAKLIETLAEDCEEGQMELMADYVCIKLLKRMLKMRDPTLKVRGSCALWSIAGDLISNKRVIASHMGLEMLVDMLTIHYEELDFVCSQALASLATELGDNQNRIISVGGVKPLVDVLTLPTSQRVCLSVVHTLSAICMKPALVPNRHAQNMIAFGKGLSILAGMVTSTNVAEIVQVETACTLAKLVLNNKRNDSILTKQIGFSYQQIFRFLKSSESNVRLLAGHCLALLAYNNPSKALMLKQCGTLHMSNFKPFLQSDNQFYHVHSAFQMVVLSSILEGVKSEEAVIQGVKMLVNLVSSEVEQTKVLSAEFIASLARSQNGIPGVLVIAGLLDPLMNNRTSNDPVIESSSVALGYLTFNPMASRMMLTMFRDDPELFNVFSRMFPLITYSAKFLTTWKHITRPGLPSLRFVELD